MEIQTTSPEPTYTNEPQKEHHWLHKLVGEWTCETKFTLPQAAEPTGDKAAETPCTEAATKGTESVRAIGGLWVQAETHGQMPGGMPLTAQMTLGYDPQKKRYVGTWVGSIMTYLWVYEGELDADEKVLSLYAEGPSMADDGKMGKYKDVITLQSDDQRTLTSHTLGQDGKWQEFMTIHYQRTK